MTAAGTSGASGLRRWTVSRDGFRRPRFNTGPGSRTIGGKGPTYDAAGAFGGPIRFEHPGCCWASSGGGSNRLPDLAPTQGNAAGRPSHGFPGRADTRLRKARGRAPPIRTGADRASGSGCRWGQDSTRPTRALVELPLGRKHDEVVFVMAGELATSSTAATRDRPLEPRPTAGPRTHQHCLAQPGWPLVPSLVRVACVCRGADRTKGPPRPPLINRRWSSLNLDSPTTSTLPRAWTVGPGPHNPVSGDRQCRPGRGSPRPGRRPEAQPANLGDPAPGQVLRAVSFVIGTSTAPECHWRKHEPSGGPIKGGCTQPVIGRASRSRTGVHVSSSTRSVAT